MKKLLAILLALAMVLALTACSSDSGKSISEDKPHLDYEEEQEEPAEEEQEEEPAVEEEVPEEEVTEEVPEEEPVAAETEEQPVEEAPEEEAPAEEVPEEEASASEGVTLGTVNGYVYENTSLGYGCELNADWFFYDEAQMEQMNQQSLANFDDEELRERLANVNMFYDMIAQPNDLTGMLQVAVENLGLIYGTVLTVEDYIDITLSSLEANMLSAGYTTCNVYTETGMFAGEERTIIVVEGEMQGVAVYQRMVPVKVGNHIALYACASYVSDNTEELLTYFYALD